MDYSLANDMGHYRELLIYRWCSSGNCPLFKGVYHHLYDGFRPDDSWHVKSSCKYCRGKGLVPSPETLGIGFLRKLKLETLKAESSSVKGIVPVEVADYLLNNKRKDILDLELMRDISITIEGDSAMVPGESNIIC